MGDLTPRDPLLDIRAGFLIPVKQYLSRNFMMIKWATFVFAVIGAFFLCGIGGAVTAEWLGLWVLPVAGFCAAFGVVSLAFVSAPAKRSEVAITVFVAGALLAWFLIEPSWYPEIYEEKAYQSTHFPFLVTILGGVVALAIALLPFKKWSRTA